MKVPFRRRAALLGALVSAICAPPSWAQSANPSAATADDENVIVVTASRREQPIAEVQASVDVIRQEELQTFSGASVTEALRYAPGVDARSSGANATVTIRGVIPGAGSGVQILYDGLPRPAKYGIGNLNLFALEDVRQVEIIRGPMSALYGANAIGGVVNVMTSLPGEGPELSLRGTIGAMPHGGDRGTEYLGATVQRRFGDFGHRLSLEGRRSEGFRFNGANPAEDLSGVEQTGVTYSGAWAPAGSAVLRWTLEGFSQDDRRDAVVAASPPTRPSPVPYEAFEREDRLFGAVQFSGDWGPGELAFDLAHARATGETNRSFPAVESTEYTQSIAQARYLVSFGDHDALIGLGAGWDDIDVSINSVRAEQENLFALAQDEWRFAPGWRLIAGLRIDRFDGFGAQTSPRVSLGWNGDRLYARAAYGHAFRAPTVLEQYSRFTRGRFIIIGTPDLNPETANSYEAALGWRQESFSFELVAHDTTIENLIETYQPGGTIGGLITTRYRNRAIAELRGLEISARWRASSWLSLSGSYDYLLAEDGQTHARLTGRAAHTARVQADFDWGRWSGVVRARHLENLWGADPTVRGSAPFGSEYTVVDLQAAYSIRDNLRLSLGLDNIFDRTTPINYSTVGAIEDPPGAFAYASLRWSR